MLYWKNVPPAIALNYFYKEYASHPTTAKFAAKTLQRFKPVRLIPLCVITAWKHMRMYICMHEITIVLAKIYYMYL